MANQILEHQSRRLILVRNLGRQVPKETAPSRNAMPRDPVIAARNAHDESLTAIERALRRILDEDRALREDARSATLFPHIEAINDDQPCS